MKLGIDARPLQHETQFRGIGKALEFLLLALKPALDANDSIVFYIDQGLPWPKQLDNFPDAKVIKVPTSKLGRKRYFRSFMASFKTITPRRGDIDVLLQYDAGFGIPKSVPTVVVFHDLIPYLFRSQEKQRPVIGLRKGKDALARSLYWKKYLRALDSYKHAAKVIAISQSSRNDLLSHVKGVKPSDVVVVNHGLNILGSSGQPGQAIKKLGGKHFLLYVGGIDIRKNIIGLLQDFYKLKPNFPDLQLVMIGKEFELKDRLQDLGWEKQLETEPAYAKDVKIPGFVTAADLVYLYKSAAAFVFPSRYEGFGLPILEAMGLGCPVVAYSNSSIPEVAGDAALIVKDGESMAPAISKMLSNSKLRQELIKKGRQRAAEFSWDHSAKQTLEILRKAAAKN